MRRAAARWIALLALALAPRADLRATLDELAELGLDAEVVARGLDAARPGGALAADGEAVARVALALFAVGREDEAFALLEGARPAGAGGEVAIQLARARLHLGRDELDRALALLAVDPRAPAAPRHEAPECALLLGRALVRAGRHAEAEPLLARFVRDAPLSAEAPSAWHMLFDCAVRRGDLARARECRDEKERWTLWHELMRARRLQARRDPDARLPRLGIALLWIEAGRLDDARAALDALLARHPDDVEGWLLSGEVERKAGRLDAAAQAWARALELDPDEPRARFDLALCHRDAGRAADARRELETLLEGGAADDPRFLSAHLELARLLRAGGELEQAEARFAEYRARGGTERLE